MTPRLRQILGMLDKSPADAFLLYGAALEIKKTGDHARAIEYLDKCLAVDPGYCYAYYQKGHSQEEMGDTQAAATTYRAGIAAARKVGDVKAEGELSQVLSIIE
jgi:tetratricopeptide (TPR) repeat protein